MEMKPDLALSILNEHPVRLDGPQLLHQLVETSRMSSDCAIDFLENDGTRRKISYQSLHELSDALARRIRRSLSDQKQNTAVIPVLLPQSPELYVTLLAILKAGGAFCPLNLDAPEERLNFILQDVSAFLVITTSSLKAKIPRKTNLEMLYVDCELHQNCIDSSFDEAAIYPMELAYLLYTSGSTGVPKAVAVSHFAVTQSLLAHDRHIPQFSRFLQFAVPTFDVSIFEIFFPLFRRSTLVGCTRPEMLNDLPGVIGRMDVDAAELTPTVVGNLLRGRKSVPGLKLLLTIGEMLTQPIVEDFGGNDTKQSILWGMYGPTEAAIHCTLQSSFQSNSRVGNIGFPLDTVSAFVVVPISEQSPATSEIKVLPLGQTGELVIGGAQIAEGYLNRLELMESAFIYHQHFGRLYRTGDKARVLPNGSLECLGRIISGQVKLRGQRIELGEVEQVVFKLDGCLNAAAGIANDILVVFCLADLAKISRKDVMEICERWLPAFMVPGDVVLLAELPQLPSGKVDKKKLERDYIQRKEAADMEMEEISDGSKDEILNIVRSVLGGSITSSTYLPSAGLDSLRSIRIASLLRTSSYPVCATDVLSAADVKSLHPLLGAQSKIRNSKAHLQSIQNAFSSLKESVLKSPDFQDHSQHIDDVAPCTPLQEAMIAETAIDHTSYCNWVEIEFVDSFSFADLRGFLNTLAAKNEILRSGFCSMPHSTKSYAQIIWKNLEDTQIVETTLFSRNYSLESPQSLLRPLKIQIDISRDRPRVLFQIPHHLYDGWSFDLIMRDLSNLSLGKVLDDRPQYKEVARYYATISESQEYDASKVYWKELLSDYRPIALPKFTGRLLPSAAIHSTARTSAINLIQLKLRATELSINPQVFFQAGLAYLLSSYLGTTDIIFGTVSSGRTIPVPGIDEIVGPCIASLPLRVSTSHHGTVKNLLQNIHNSNRAMINHCTIPLKDIKSLCGLKPGTHLFDVLFVWQETLHSREIDRSPVKLVNNADQLEFKLTLEIEPVQDEILVKATYNSSIIPESQINLLFSQIDELVEYFISHDDADLHHVTDCFSKPSLSIANPKPKKYCFDYGPAFSVEKWASECPERPALEFSSIIGGSIKEKESLTYRDLNCRASQLANMLRDKGFGAEELICVFMEKSIDLYVSILAIMKLGLGYLPITPETPLERITWILNEARIVVCLTKSTASGLLPSTRSYAVLDLDILDLSEYSDQNLDISYRGSNLAYAVFTSGSTGTPKGVLVTQDNLMSNLHALDQIYPAPKGSRLLQSCSQAFDVSVFEIFFSWHVGICLCSATKDDVFHDFESAINQMGITHLSLTPTVASLTLPDNVPTVKFLVTAGEPLTEHVRRHWANNGLYQGYGPSETTNICTLRPHVTAADLINNIGPPLANTSAFVIHPNSNRLVPRGGVGELCFGGDQVCRGYLNMSDLTVAKFIDHPEYGRIYRSGDLGQLLPDDSILFVGRSDDQVKIRGQRVELGEINASILDFDYVRDCVSIVIDHKGQIQMPQKLVTFWVPSDSMSQDFCVLPSKGQISLTISTTFKVLIARLPTYMVPAHLVPVTKVPTTHQSKVDKRRLVAAYGDLTTVYLQSVAHHTTEIDNSVEWSSLEQNIATALSQVIGVSKLDIGRNSSFFSLGLDSISAISFSRSLRNCGIIDAPVPIILQNATIALLASKISAPAVPQMPIHERSRSDVQQAFSEDQLSHIHSSFGKYRRNIEKILPCTPLQEAMLYTGDSVQTSTYYNRMIFDIVGDVKRLRKCWVAMFERHEILRTCFFPTDDSRYAFAQVVLQHRDPDWDEIALRTENLDQQIEKYVVDALSARLDSNKPPVRLSVVTIGDSKLLLFCCHHALYDGAAIAHLLHEVEELYHCSKLLPPVPYEPYLEHMISLNYDEADRFWSSKLSGFEPSSFPDLTGRSTISGKGSKTYGVLLKTLQTPLNDILEGCQRMSLSLLSMTQAVWAKLLLSYLGESDICFGNIVSGRTIPVDDLERLVAPCFNTIPVRVEIVPENNNLELMQRLQESNLSSLPYQLTPLRRIQSNISHRGKRLFDTLFILQQTRAELDHSIWVLKEDVGKMDVPLVCEISPNKSQNSLELTLHYQHQLILDDAAKLIADTYDYTLRSCVTSPSASAIGAINFPTRLLSTSNSDLCYSSPADGPFLHSNFERHAAIRPNAIALDFQYEDGSRTSWSFKNLNEVSNKVAHALLQLEIQPEDVVPVSMPKCPFFYASILGILKSGGAFTPVDHRLPEARKKYMLDELGSKVVLCLDGSSSSWSGDIQCLNISTLGHYSKQNPVVPNLKPDSLAYCLYTSGSTGKPKAVSVEHRNPIQTIESSKLIIPWTHESRILQYAAITFDMCYYDCFLAWSFGFCLCSAEQSTMLNDLTGVINSMEISLLDLTPSVAVSLEKDEVPSVEFLYCIGEEMSPDIVQRWEGKCVNSYGPTEAAFCCTIFPVSKAVKSAVIGKPFPSTSFTVLSKSGGRDVPVLGVGELHIGGSQVARGYYANDELSRSKFIERDGERLYKSGDMVRMLANNNFEFLGRADDQVKIHGLRVELGEINHVIQGSHEKIFKVTTQIISSSESTKGQLVAFLVTRVQEYSALKEDIKNGARRAAAEQLPPYMIPQFFIFIDNIPLSAAGKADKKALTEIFRTSEEINFEVTSSLAEHSSDWNHVEQEIRNAFSMLSRIPLEKIKRKTTIYQLGLDSISAVQLASRLRRKGFQVSAGDVFEHPNCADLAAKLQVSSTPKHSQSLDFAAFDRQFRNEICESYNLKSTSIESIRPCTPLQQGMIAKFLHSKEGLYYNYLRLRIEQDLDAFRLRFAWKSALQRHEMLRTGFAHINHRQHSFAMIHYSDSLIDIPWDGDEENNISEIEVGHWIRRSAAKALESLHEPPWRIRIVRNGNISSIHLALFHALYDAQSIRIILRDVAAVYHNQIELSRKPIEPALGEILNAATADGDGDARRRFWEEKTKDMVLNHFPNMLPLRTKSASIDVVSKSCTRSRSEFEAGCRIANISMQAAGQAAWAQVLSAYIGEPVVTFGVVLSGRTTEGADSVAFPYITIVPMTCRTDQSKRATLDQIMSYNSSVQRHQFTALTEIQRIAGHPDEQLFDTIFTYQKLATRTDVDSLWKVVDERATVDYPISIEMEPLPENNLGFRITFASNILPREQALLLLDQIKTLFSEFIFCAEEEIVTAIERTPLLYSITPAKNVEISSEVTLLHQFVEYSVLKHPQKIALEFASALHEDKFVSQCWTYKELDAEGNKIANLLLKNGVKPGRLVAICFDKCPEASFAILGILKAGCAFVAVDPGSPSARKSFIIKDSGADVLLSMRNQSLDLECHIEVPTVNLDDVSETILTTKPALERIISPQDRSYCLYTSGTTGTPKGCELTHENAVQAMLSFQRLFSPHWDENSRWLQFASFHFDVSVLEQYWSWSVGIRVVSAPRDLIFEDLPASIKQLEITHIDLTPSLARILHPDDVPSLCRGVFITGGEQLKQEILDVWGPKGVIYNGYGPTEATIGVTMYPRVPENGKPSNIGPQFDNVGSYVLQPNTDIPVLRGAVGELCVSGKLVGKGYLNRPDLTKGRFPFLERFGERVYRTGDLVRILHNNCFDFLGRADDQVKLRGQRLEIGEINIVIKQSSDTILDIATLVLKHPKQQKEQLVAFIVNSSSSKQKEEPMVLLKHTGHLTMIKERCQDRLPGYMVPTHFVLLTSMPLSTNNKVDAKMLKGLYNSLSTEDLQLLSGLSNDQSDRWSQEEQKIRTVLAKMVQVDENSISKSSSIFELGLDSISVIGFSRELKNAGLSNVEASLVMKNSSISRLAKHLASRSNSKLQDPDSIISARQAITAVQQRHKSTVIKALDIQKSDVEAISPCTPLQEGIISRSHETSKPLYFGTFHFQLFDEVEESKLRAAWETVFKSTQILRTSFLASEDGFLQVALRNIPLPWEEYSISNTAEMDSFLGTCRDKWSNQNRINFHRPFELVIVRSPLRKVLAVHIFHALYDGNSLPMIFEKVWEEYHSKDGIDYGPPFQSVLAYGPLRRAEAARSFWSAHLEGVSFQPSPRMISEPQKVESVVTRKVGELEGYEAVRRKLNVTDQAIAQGCWAAVLQKHFGGAVTQGMVVSGRLVDFDGIERIIGPLFNTIPFHIRFSNTDTWELVVKRCHDFNTSTIPFQHTALRDIMKWVKCTPGEPLFNALFVFQKGTDDTRSFASNDMWQLVDNISQADYPIAFEVEQKDGGTLNLTIVAQGHISDSKSSSRLLEEFEKALKALLDNPDTLISDSVGEVRGSTMSNGISEETNGRLENSSNGIVDFEWTAEACCIREEISILASAGSDEVKAHTSIFKLGLDSIDAIKLSSRLKKRGIDLSVSQIMQNLTIEKMTLQMSHHSSIKPSPPSESTLKTQQKLLENYFRKNGRDMDNIECIYPVTPLQEAMVAGMISSNFTKYFNHDVLKLSRQIDIQNLWNAWSTVIDNSPILRTSFIEIDDPRVEGPFSQVTYRSSGVTRNEVNISELNELTNLFEDIREKTVRAGDQAKLLQLTLVNTPTDKYMVLSIAHAIYDGWSLGLLHEDVRKAYAGDPRYRKPYERALEEILDASGSEAHSFWQGFLSGAKSIAFPHRQRLQTQSDEKVHREEHISCIPASPVRSFCKKHGITLQTLGQTVWSFVLASYLHSLDVTFGTVLSGRDSAETADVLFPTINTVAIRTILYGSRGEILQYVQENFTSIRRYQHFPLRKAQVLAGSPGTALFDTLFIYQKRPEVIAKSTKSLYESVGGASDVEYPVCVEMEIIDNELIWRCACKDEVLECDGAEELLDRLDIVLNNILDDPDAATLEIGSDGTRICGLPAFTGNFKDAGREAGDNSNGHAVAPPSSIWSPIERTIREVLSTVSKVPESQISKNITMFHLGLDSINAIKVSALLRKRLIRLSVSEILRAATVETMARIIDERSSRTIKCETDPEVTLSEALKEIDETETILHAGISPNSIEKILPANSGQVYMLSTWENTQGVLFYPEFKYRMADSGGVDSLRKSWQTLIAQNAILRTCFLGTGNRDIPFIQAVLREVDESFHDITGNAQDGMRYYIEQHSQRQPYASLFVQRSDGDWLLTLKVHHALYDGVSLPQLVQHFQDLCTSTRKPPPQTSAFTSLLSMSMGENRIKRKVFWTSYLRGISGRSLIQPDDAKCARAEHFLPNVLPDIKDLDELGRNSGLSMQSLFFAAYARLYAALVSKPETGLQNASSGDVIIGIYLANRSHAIEGLSGVAAPTVNLVPLRVKVPLRNTLLESAVRIQSDLQDIGSMENSSVGLWEIADWTGVKVETFVNFLKLPERDDDSTGRIKIREECADLTESWSRVVEPPMQQFVEPDELKEKNIVKDAYLHTIDVEATVKNGSLDVGVFCPISMLSLEDAEKLVFNLRKEFMHLFND